MSNITVEYPTFDSHQFCIDKQCLCKAVVNGTAAGSILNNLTLPEQSLEQKNAKGGALRYDKNKPMMELISPIAMIGLAQVLTKGAAKYSPGNWRKGMEWSRSIGSLQRHMAEYMMGNDYDTDPNCETCKSNNCKNHTGELHIDMVLCNAMFLSEYARTHKELDDRFKVIDLLK